MRLSTFAAGFALATLACGDSTGVSPDDLAGTWSAFVIEFSNPDDLTQVREVYNSGARLDVTFGADGGYAIDYSFPGEADEAEIGTFVVDGGTLTFSPTGGDPYDAVVSRTGDELSLQTDEAEYDFDNDGDEEDALLRIRLRR